jgi:uncharacterized membrane protein
VAGTVSGIAVVLTGVVDLLAIPRTEKQAFGTALTHGFINFTLICIYAVVAYKEWKLYPSFPLGVGSLVFKAILTAALFAGNHFGGTLVYKYLIGTRKQ